MKKYLSLLLIIAISIPLVSCQKVEVFMENDLALLSSDQIYGVTTDALEESVIDGSGVINKNINVTKLKKSSVSSESIRVRETSENSRLLVDNKNPLFMFHSTDFPDKTYGEEIAIVYNALPEDIKPFSAMYGAINTSQSDINKFIGEIDDLLNCTDAENVPILVQIECWNSVDTREGFTYDQLADLLERHPSLMGFVHVELSCLGLVQEEINRIKTTINACKDYNALFIWQEMEYKWEKDTNTINLAFDDEELYTLMSGYSHNIIIQDKHNGQGRHFAVQSAAMGAWLAGVCGNWGSNVESWLWWEEGLGTYNDMGNLPRSLHDNFTWTYPLSLGGIDTICDMVGGANMYSSEWLRLYEANGNSLEFGESFLSVIYPLYQKILSGAVPDKNEVINNIKVVYQFTSPKDKFMRGIEAQLFIDTYGLTSRLYKKYSPYNVTKKWIPYTGRYYIIPTLPKYADVSKILPNADILTTDNYKSKFNTTASKIEYFNSKYNQTYAGNATLYSVNGLTYIFNNLENQTQKQAAEYILPNSKLKITTVMREHTYLVIDDNDEKIDIEITNVRLDSAKVSAGLENEYLFRRSYYRGGKMNSESDFRITEITITGLTKMPDVKASGSNGAKATISYNKKDQKATIKVLSNGVVKLSINK